MSSMAGSGQGPWQIKRINSVTGFNNSELSAALMSKYSVAGVRKIFSFHYFNVTYSQVKQRSFGAILVSEAHQRKNQTPVWMTMMKKIGKSDHKAHMHSLQDP